jgi:transcriptional regulator with XRE-family HTH domain
VLKEARERAGLTQEAVARRIGVATSQISQVESGRRSDPYFSTVAKIAGACGVSLDALAAESGYRGFGDRSTTARASRDVEFLAATSRVQVLQRQLSTLTQRLGIAAGELVDTVDGTQKSNRRKSVRKRRS